MTTDRNEPTMRAGRTTPAKGRRHTLAGVLLVALALIASACGAPMVPDPDPEAAAFGETAFGLAAGGNELVRFGTAGGSTMAITGVTNGTSLLAIDYRPSNGLLYALASDGQLYTLDADGTAHAVGLPQSYGDLGEGVAFDFNPQVDAIRVVVTSNGGNFVANPVSGGRAEFTASAFAGGDANAGTTPSVAATAYDMNIAPFPATGATVQYSIETQANVLAIQEKNAGTLNTVAPLGMDVAADAALDISGETGTAYVLLTAEGMRHMYEIDLDDGSLLLLAVEATQLVDFTIVPGGMIADAPVLSESAFGLSMDGLRLVAIGGASMEIAGLNDDTSLLALDHRPSDDTLYALGSDGQLYTLAQDGSASAVGAPQTYGDLGGGVAFDVNAQVDAIRVVTTAEGRNFVTTPATGETVEFTTSAFADGDEFAGTMPSVAATAYDLSLSPFPDGSVTTQYSLESEANVLAVQGKNAGTLETIAELPFDFTSLAGLDISSATGTAYALLTTMDGAQGLYEIDVESGALTRLATPVTDLRAVVIVPD